MSETVLDNEFSMAKKLAMLSAELDDFKNQFNPEFRFAAMNVVDVMQAMVEILAGDRIGEIYDLSDEG